MLALALAPVCVCEHTSHGLLFTDFVLPDADRGDFHSPPVLPDTPTNGGIRHSGHAAAEETDSQTISIPTISHFTETTARP